MKNNCYNNSTKLIERGINDMAVQYAVVPEEKKTYAILYGTKYDALNQIKKLMKNSTLGIENSKKYMMPSIFKVSTVCDPEDEYNVEEGKKIAKEKLMKHYHESIDRRIDMFKKDLKKLYNGLCE
jgi:hypothetical protein